MVYSFFVNENQLQDWSTAAEHVKDEYGVEKALGYVIGEKFHSVLQVAASYRETMKSIEEEDRQDEAYEKIKKRVSEEKDILEEFARLIEGIFARHEIYAYFGSHPRFGAMGHVASEEEHTLMVEKGMVERTIETEVEDALLFGEIKKYFIR